MKKDFDIPRMLKKFEVAIAPFPKAAMFELFEQGYKTLFEQLLACLISIRTLDETTIPISKRLFSRARKPSELIQIKHGELADLLHGSRYPGQKAETMLEIARITIEKYGGKLPEDMASLTALKGVGPKCAGLALGIAGGIQAISVDVHVHRVVNRWGITQTGDPVKTMKELEQIVPKKGNGSM